jgi:hypothetical protein
MERKLTKDFILPTTAACQVCKYEMTDICQECLENKLDCFEPRAIPFAFLRVFTMDEYDQLPNVVKGKILAFYVIKIMEVLNGHDPDSK